MLLMMLLLDVNVSVCLSMQLPHCDDACAIDEVVSSGDMGMLNGFCVFV